MKKYLEYLAKNKTVTDGEEIEFNGEVHVIGKMDEEEITSMRAEGIELLKTEVKYKNKTVQLKDIKSGRDLFNITEAIGLKGNLTGMWYVWREIRMEERLKNLSSKAQEQIKALTQE